MKSFTQRWIALLALSALGGALGNACSASPGTPQQTSSGQGGSATSGGTGGDDSTGSLVGSGGNGGDPQITSGTGGSTGPGAGGGCAKAASEAMNKPQPADIIIAVDTSGSMDEESAQVQQHLNDFATIITSSGIDVHVILLADSSICIPAPLGSGACNGGDEKLPAFRHVMETINSTDALQKFIATYPQWKDSLRPDASKTFAVVSDDNSDLSAGDFTSQLLALDPPTFQKFKFDAIVSFDDPLVCTGCFFACATCASACCEKAAFCAPISAAEGKVYKDLVQQTGGVIGDLCQQNFAPVFMDMGTAVVQGASISCTYDIPMVPDGGMIDPDKVNVSYTPGGGGMEQAILASPGGAAGCGQKGGWYYDDPQNPTKIIMCPTTCAALQGDPNGKVEVVFGCATVIKPPE
ncbi:MAG: hypothetical protein U0359_19610 [Byssovorax sp.]